MVKKLFQYHPFKTNKKLILPRKVEFSSKWEGSWAFEEVKCENELVGGELRLIGDVLRFVLLTADVFWSVRLTGNVLLTGDELGTEQGTEQGTKLGSSLSPNF